MPRSERCRIRGNCLNGIVLLSLAQAPAADGAPAAAGLLPLRSAWRWSSRPGVGRKRRSLLEALGVGGGSAAGGASGAGRPQRRAAGRSEPSNGLEAFRRSLAGLGERPKAVSEALRTMARAWAGGERTRPSWKTIEAGPAARLLGGRLGSAGLWSKPIACYRGFGRIAGVQGLPGKARSPPETDSCLPKSGLGLQFH
jgi:hypothetical protein